MPFAKVATAQTNLLKAKIIDVEVDISGGLYSFTIVGLPDKAVEESRDRISAAIKNSGFESPKRKNEKVVIALAPADLKKEGPAFDLAIALGYLSAADAIKFSPKNRLFLGELSLDGGLRPISGILPLVEEAKRRGFEEIFLPEENVREAALIGGLKIFGGKTLGEIVAHLNERHDAVPEGRMKIIPAPRTQIDYETDAPAAVDFADIRGQQTAKRGLEIAAAGGHNIAMWGPPGTGKTMLARAFTGILPPLSFEDILEVTGIHSVAGTLSGALVTRPPMRSPHHSASHISIIGGGANPKPGEVTLAHRGVLFLDEFPEFDRRVVEALRQPLEDKVISVARVKGTARFPANFILVATMNPCPCGNFGSKRKPCVCPPSQLVRYQRKISGPIMDRLDLWIEVGAVDHKLLSEKRKTDGETEKIRSSVARVREIQALRFAGLKNVRLNSDMGPKELEKFAPMPAAARAELNASAERLGLSARGYHRTIKLARTVADIMGHNDITRDDIMEAIQYRPKDNKNIL